VVGIKNTTTILMYKSFKTVVGIKNTTTILMFGIYF